MEFIIQAKDLSKKFDGKTILNQVNLNVRSGEIYGLLGANGAGKTTLMKMMLGLIKPSSGKISVLNNDVTNDDMSYLAQIGSLIETPIFYQHLTVEENLDLHCDYLDERYKKDIPKILDLVGLKNAQGECIKTLSLGMKQRLAIGRALLCEPKLLILDEPINGIDPEGIVDIRNILLHINKERNVAIILSSHIIHEVEKIADTVGIINQGRLLEEVPSEIFESDDFNLEEHYIELMHRVPDVQHN